MADEQSVFLDKKEKQYCTSSLARFLGYPACNEIVGAKSEPLKTLQILKPEDPNYALRFLIAAHQLSKLDFNREENLKFLVSAVERNPPILDELASFFIPGRSFLSQGNPSEASKQFFLAGSYYWLEMARKQKQPDIFFDIANAAAETNKFPVQIFKLIKDSDANYEKLLLKTSWEVARASVSGSPLADKHTQDLLIKRFDEKPHLIRQFIPQLLAETTTKEWLNRNASTWMFLSLKHHQPESYNLILAQWENPDPRIKISGDPEEINQQRKWNHRDRVRELEETLNRYSQVKSQQTPFISIDASKPGLERVVRDLSTAYAESDAEDSYKTDDPRGFENDFQRNKNRIFNVIRRNPRIFDGVVKNLSYDKNDTGMFTILGSIISGTGKSYDERKKEYHQDWIDRDPVGWFKLARETKNDEHSVRLGLNAARKRPWELLPALQPNDPGRREIVVTAINKMCGDYERVEREFERNNYLAAQAILGNTAESRGILTDVVSNPDSAKWLATHTNRLIAALPGRPDLHNMLLRNLKDVASTANTSAVVFRLAARNVEEFRNSRDLTFLIKNTFSIPAVTREDAIQGMKDLAPLSKILQDNRLLHLRAYSMGDALYHVPENPSLTEQIEKYTRGHTQSLLEINWREVASAIPREEGKKLFDYVTNTVLTADGIDNHTTKQAYQDKFISKVRKELAASYRLPEKISEEATADDIHRRNSLLTLKYFIEGSQNDSLQQVVDEERKARIEALQKRKR